MYCDEGKVPSEGMKREPAVGVSRSCAGLSVPVAAARGVRRVRPIKRVFKQGRRFFELPMRVVSRAKRLVPKKVSGRAF